MVETYVERVHTESIVLDIGQGIGALVVYTGKELLGKEIQVSPKGNRLARLTHTAVWERRFNGRVVFAGVYPSLPEGGYIVWTHPSKEVTIVGGQVAELDMRDITTLYIPPASHTHNAGGGEA